MKLTGSDHVEWTISCAGNSTIVIFQDYAKVGVSGTEPDDQVVTHNSPAKSPSRSIVFSVFDNPSNLVYTPVPTSPNTLPICLMPTFALSFLLLVVVIELLVLIIGQELQPVGRRVMNR